MTKASRSSARQAWLFSIPLLSLLLLWAALTYSGAVAPFFLPTPTAVAKAFSQSFSTGALMTHLTASSFRVFTGFALAALCGIPVGILMGSFPTFRKVFEPTNNLIRYMPVPALVPLIILWFGVSDLAQVAVIFVGTFFQLTLLVADIAANVPMALLELGKTLGLTTTALLSRIVIPFAAPGVFDACRVTLGWAWSYLVVAEIIGANQGIGQMIIVGQRFLRTDIVVAGILSIAILGLISDFVFARLHPLLFPWTEKAVGSRPR